MTIALLSLTLVLLLTQIFIPTVRANKAVAARRFGYEYRHMQIEAVKRYYSDLSNLTHREISKRYNVSQAYHRMGREHLRLGE